MWDKGKHLRHVRYVKHGRHVGQVKTREKLWESQWTKLIHGSQVVVAYSVVLRAMFVIQMSATHVTLSATHA